MFKSSYDKANRTSVSSARGPGWREGLKILAAVKEASGLPLLTDVHETVQVAEVAQMADIVPPDRFASRSGAQRPARKHQEGAIPFARRHATRNCEGHFHRQPAGDSHRAR